MKYWDTESGSITLRDGMLDRVLDIELEGGMITFKEGCDSYFFATFTPSDAIEALQEAIDWIRANS